MKKTYLNDSYVRSHGKQPKGRGNWAFSVTAGDGNGAYTDLGTRFVNGTFAQARSQAAREAAEEAKSVGRVKELILETLS